MSSTSNLPGVGGVDDLDNVPEARTSHGECIRRESAWIELVRYLVDEGGMAPPYGSRGLWVDLYDKAMEGHDA